MLDGGGWIGLQRQNRQYTKHMLHLVVESADVGPSGRGSGGARVPRTASQVRVSTVHSNVDSR